MACAQAEMAPLAMVMRKFDGGRTYPWHGFRTKRLMPA
jgi:hypothetical protein